MVTFVVVSTSNFFFSSSSGLHHPRLPHGDVVTLFDHRPRGRICSWSQIIAILFIPASKSSRQAHGHVCFTLVDSAPATRGIALCQLWPYTRVAAMLLYSSNI